MNWFLINLERIVCFLVGSVFSGDTNRCCHAAEPLHRNEKKMNVRILFKAATDRWTMCDSLLEERWRMWLALTVQNRTQPVGVFCLKICACNYWMKQPELLAALTCNKKISLVAERCNEHALSWHWLVDVVANLYFWQTAVVEENEVTCQTRAHSLALPRTWSGCSYGRWSLSRNQRSSTSKSRAATEARFGRALCL